MLAIERYILQENNNRLNFSCNDIAGLTLQIPDLVGTQPSVSRDWPIYEENFDFEEPNEPEIVIYLLPSSQPFVGHAAVVAYNHPVDPLLNIVAQSDGNAVSSGIFFTHVKDSQHYRTENPPMFGE